MTSSPGAAARARLRRSMAAELRQSRRHLLALLAGLDELDGAWRPPGGDALPAKWHAGRIAFLERQRVSAATGGPLAVLPPVEAHFARSLQAADDPRLPAWRDIRASLASVRAVSLALNRAVADPRALSECLRAVVNDEYSEARFIRVLRRQLGLPDVAEPSGPHVRVDTDADAPPRFHVETWELESPRPRRPSVVSLAAHRLRAAEESLDLGQRLVAGRDLRGALRCFERAADLKETADALTYQGWMHAMLGDVDRAEGLCHRAIALDPDFGNPYNDLGTFCVQRSDFDQAVEWFERAKRARRYEPRHFPYVNLGRLYASRGELEKALAEFEGALTIQPGDPELRLAVERLRRETGRRSEA